MNLITAAKAHALLHGQANTDCENVAAVAPSILRHRIAPNFTAQGEGITADALVAHILEAIPSNEVIA